eukprot:Polyplicarium_translucidae@DN1075_c0_g1_i2.p1
MNRLFGAAVAEAQSSCQKGAEAPRSSGGATGVSFQVSARRSRKSIFERMDGPPLAPIRSYSAGPGAKPPHSDGCVAGASRGDGGARRVIRRVAIGGRDAPSPYGNYTQDERWHHDLYDGPELLPEYGSSVFVRHLPKTIKASQLEMLFSRVADVFSVKIDQGPLPTAVVSFHSRDAAARAAKEFHRSRSFGTQMKVTVIDEKSKLRDRNTN